MVSENPFEKAHAETKVTNHFMASFESYALVARKKKQ